MMIVESVSIYVVVTMTFGDEHKLKKYFRIDVPLLSSFSLIFMSSFIGLTIYLNDDYPILTEFCSIYLPGASAISTTHRSLLLNQLILQHVAILISGIIFWCVHNHLKSSSKLFSEGENTVKGIINRKHIALKMFAKLVIFPSLWYNLIYINLFLHILYERLTGPDYLIDYYLLTIGLPIWSLYNPANYVLKRLAKHWTKKWSLKYVIHRYSEYKSRGLAPPGDQKSAVSRNSWSYLNIAHPELQ